MLYLGLVYLFQDGGGFRVTKVKGLEKFLQYALNSSYVGFPLVVFSKTKHFSQKSLLHWKIDVREEKAALVLWGFLDGTAPLHIRGLLQLELAELFAIEENLD